MCSRYFDTSIRDSVSCDLRFCCSVLGAKTTKLRPFDGVPGWLGSRAGSRSGSRDDHERATGAICTYACVLILPRPFPASPASIPRDHQNQLHMQDGLSMNSRFGLSGPAVEPDSRSIRPRARAFHRTASEEGHPVPFMAMDCEWQAATPTREPFCGTILLGDED